MKKPTEEFIKELVQPFQKMDYINDERGYIVWRVGTGENVELLHIRVHDKRKGYGSQLINEMMDKLKQNPPYATVFGFTRTSNNEAHEFYKANGFTLTKVDGVYKDGTAVLFSKNYD